MTELILNGVQVDAGSGDVSLLQALRDRLGVRSAKDGCSPQGQCGSCTVWIDGQPRVACVTPLGRVAGRQVTTLEGLTDAAQWAARFTSCGASQCGFCTPGIIMRIAALHQPDGAEVRQALLAHQCRCTGWNTIVDAALGAVATIERDMAAAARRASLEGGEPQSVGDHVALGAAGFSADSAPDGSLVAVRSSGGEWVVGDDIAAARRAAGRVQGRRSTVPMSWPIDVPAGDWRYTLQTTWVDPGYVEPDAAWCAPGRAPSALLANGGAFGGKTHSEVGAAARRLADLHDRPVLATYTREDAIRLGAKRPPLAAGIDDAGRGAVRVARTQGIVAAIHRVAPGWSVEEVDVAGPPTSVALRAAGWGEVAVLLAAARGQATVTAPNGARAAATIDASGVHVRVWCGAVLDEVVARSYCVGAAHMALGWVRSEGVAVDGNGVPVDLTIRALGLVRAIDTPPIHVAIEPSEEEPVNGSDAVFAAVAAAVWRADGYPPRWPTMRA